MDWSILKKQQKQIHDGVIYSAHELEGDRLVKAWNESKRRALIAAWWQAQQENTDPLNDTIPYIFTWKEGYSVKGQNGDSRN